MLRQGLVHTEHMHLVCLEDGLEMLIAYDPPLVIRLL